MIEDLPKVRFCRHCGNCANCMPCYSYHNGTYRVVKFCAEDTPSGQLEKIAYAIEDSLTDGSPCDAEVMKWLGLKPGDHPLDSTRCREDVVVCDAWVEHDV